MAAEQQYRVRVALVQFKTATPSSDSLRLGLRNAGAGQIISGHEIDPAHLAHLLSVRMVEPVDPTPAPGEPATTG